MIQAPPVSLRFPRPKILGALDWKKVMNKESGDNIATLEQPMQMTRVFQWKVACIQVGSLGRCVMLQRSAEPKSMLPDCSKERARYSFRGSHNRSPERARIHEPVHNFLVEGVILVVEFPPMVLDIAHDIAGDGGRKKPGTNYRPQQGERFLVRTVREMSCKRKVDAIDPIWRVSQNARYKPRHVVYDGSINRCLCRADVVRWQIQDACRPRTGRCACRRHVEDRMAVHVQRSGTDC